VGEGDGGVEEGPVDGGVGEGERAGVERERWMEAIYPTPCIEETDRHPYRSHVEKHRLALHFASLHSHAHQKPAKRYMVKRIHPSWS
jgi:hypothetical protein